MLSHRLRNGSWVLLASLAALSALAADGDDCTGNFDCGTDEYCAYTSNSCLTDSPYGSCVYVHPDVGCPTVWMPVCGCDLQTYSNGCYSDVAHVSILYPGECEICGTTQGVCAPGRVCLHPSADACGDANPGTCVPAADHEPRTFVFEGTVGSWFDGLGLFPGIGPGERFRGSLTYDLTTPDTGTTAEGQFGVYLHPSPPAGVRLTLADRLVRSVPDHPDLKMFVNNDVGFAGADEFGFVSENTELTPSAYSPGALEVELDWRLREFVGSSNPLTHVALPACPIDPAQFTENDLTLRIDCTVCLGPAAFVDMIGSIDVFEVDLELELNRTTLHWNPPHQCESFDVVTGDVALLGDYAAATSGCMADDLVATSSMLDPDPLPGQGHWYLVRPNRDQGSGSWDSSGGRQHRTRDAGIDGSGAGCP